MAYFSVLGAVCFLDLGQKTEQFESATDIRNQAACLLHEEKTDGSPEKPVNQQMETATPSD